MKHIILFLIAFFFITACERDMETEGPDLVDLYGELQVLEPLEVSQPSVKFADGETVHFTARFSKLVDWRLTITGQNSGAQKVFEGKSKILDATSTTWRGETTNLPFFQTEMCDVLLSAADDSLQFTEEVLIQSITETEGLVVADFENGMNPEWLTFSQAGANMSFTIADDTLAPQGQFYYDMGGEVSWDWLIGMIEFPGEAYNDNDDTHFPLSENPENVYFNALLFVPEEITNAVVLIQFREDDDEDGAFTDDSEDLYAIELRGNFEPGWQVYSAKYADLVSLVDGAPAEPSGNGVHEPNKLWRVSVLFLANPASGYSQAFLDYVVFTEGQPLIP